MNASIGEPTTPANFLLLVRTSSPPTTHDRSWERSGKSRGDTNNLCIRSSWRSHWLNTCKLGKEFLFFYLSSFCIFSHFPRHKRKQNAFLDTLALTQTIAKLAAVLPLTTTAHTHQFCFAVSVRRGSRDKTRLGSRTRCYLKAKGSTDKQE